MNVDPSLALRGVRELGNDLLRQLPNVLVAFVVFALFYLAGKLIRRTMRHLSERRRRQRNLGLVLGRLGQLAMVILGLLVGAVIIFPTFKPGDVIQLLGLGSVAVGFAFKDIFQNFLAGILLLVQEPFRAGDQIRVGEFEGTVEEIQTRATLIRTYDNRRVVIPNADLYTQKVIVNTAYDRIRLQYDVGIGYGDDVDRARRLILETLATLDDVLREPAPEALVVELAESSVVLRVLWYVRPPRRIDNLRAQDQVITALKQKLYVEEGIDLPYPTRQILVHDQTEETDGDRSRQREGWPAGRGSVPRARTIGDAIHTAGQVTAVVGTDQAAGDADRDAAA